MSQLRKALFVGGEFNDQGGKPSGYMGKLAKEIEQFNRLGTGNIFDTIDVFNGGTFGDLQYKILPKAVSANIVFWFSHTLPDKPKLVERVKEINPRAMLVCLARNDDGKDSIFLQAGKMLKYKANLMLEVRKRNDGVIEGYIYDPLGNCFLSKKEENDNIGRVAFQMTRRLWSLSRMTRIPSISIGEVIPPPESKELDEFYQISRDNAELFHGMFKSFGDRFLGNLSFRCESGFPAFTLNGLVYVSKRNIDKSNIGKDGFVAVNSNSADKDGKIELVQYYGKEKPSVDTPIQVALYKLFPQMRYSIHSHMSIKDAPFTLFPIPCGALEEIDHIKFLVKYKETPIICANLLGHGSIVLVNDLKWLKQIEFERRDLPSNMCYDYFLREGEHRIY